MKNLIIILLAIALGYAKPKVSFSGLGDVGIEMLDPATNNGGDESGFTSEEYDRIGLVQGELKVKLDSNIGFRFKGEYDINHHTFQMNKLIAQYKFGKNRIRLGYMKKPFGFEEERSRSDIPFYNRSIVNEYLSSYNLLGNDLTLGYRYRNNRFSGQLQAAIDGTNRMFLLGSAEFHKDIWRLGASLLYNNAEDAPEKSHSLLADVSFSFDSRYLFGELELTGGNNPERIFYPNYGSQEDPILFGGVRSEYRLQFPIERKVVESVSFPFEVAMATHNLGEGMTVQVRPGALVTLGKKELLTLRLYGDIRYSSEGDVDDSLELIGKSLTGDVMVVW